MLWKFQGHLNFIVRRSGTQKLTRWYGEEALMPIHEPLPHASLLHREQGVHPAELLEFQDGYAMRLGNPNTLSCEQRLKCNGRHLTECIIDNPAEHLDQDGNFWSRGLRILFLKREVFGVYILRPLLGWMFRNVNKITVISFMVR